LRIRAKQPAFHPNATQFTLAMDERLFGVWRQSLDRHQSVFAIHNVSSDTMLVSPSTINLIEGDFWVDLLSGEDIHPAGPEIPFAPYQCRWISNRAH
jgi:sucrose phosphorylase